MYVSKMFMIKNKYIYVDGFECISMVVLNGDRVVIFKMFVIVNQYVYDWF